MSRKLLLVSIVLTAVGIILLLISNPFLRFATGGTATPRFTGNFTGFRGNSTAIAGRVAAARGAGITTSIESIAGLGLVGGGLILEVFSLLLQPKTPKPTGQ